jgi:hypothetical protein
MAALTKQLATEFKRAGKKSLVLAALFAVGLCVWLPMLWKSVFRRGDTSSSTATSSAARPRTVTSTATAPPAATTTITDAASVDWKRTYRRVERSNLVQPMAVDDLVRDPFDHGWIREKRQQGGAKKDADLAAENDPNRFLVLSATLAGRNGGAAVIGDYVYRVGQEVPNEGPVRFVLREIRPDRVILERAGNLFDLRLKNLEKPLRESTDQ